MEPELDPAAQAAQHLQTLRADHGSKDPDGVIKALTALGKMGERCLLPAPRPVNSRTDSFRQHVGRYQACWEVLTAMGLVETNGDGDGVLRSTAPSERVRTVQAVVEAELATLIAAKPEIVAAQKRKEAEVESDRRERQCRKKFDEEMRQRSLEGMSSTRLGGGAFTQRGACGLQNLGNTCFMNAAAQCLAHTPPLMEYFLATPSGHVADARTPPDEIAAEFAKLMGHLHGHKFGYAVPRALKLAIEKAAPHFAGFLQHDAQELLCFLIDGLHEDLNRARGAGASAGAAVTDGLSAEECWAAYKERHDSVVVDHMQAQFRTTVACPDCDAVSVTYDPYSQVTTPLPAGATDGVTLTTLLASSAAEEVLDDDNRWFCPKCASDKRARKKIELWSVPDVLVVHLKRFRRESATSFQRNAVLVDFPLVDLDMAPHVAGPAQHGEQLYDCFAVANHRGGLGGGHYTAFCKLADDKWAEFDDSAVRSVAEVVTNSAYVLFYIRRGQAAV